MHLSKEKNNNLEINETRYPPHKICVQLPVGKAMYKQACKPPEIPYMVCFHTSIFETNGVKNHSGLKEDQCLGIYYICKQVHTKKSDKDHLPGVRVSQKCI